MKKFHSERAQAACSLITSFFWAVLIGGLMAGFVMACKTWVPGPFWGTNREIMMNVMFISTISGLVLGTCILASLFSLLFGRNTYEVGATELTVTTGTFWKSTNTIKILDIQNVSRASGPLMRLFGIEDVKLHFSSASAGVTLEQLQRIDELGADDRVAPDPQTRGLAELQRRQLVHRFVGERAAARYDTDDARPVDVPRHDADLALPR